MPGFDGTGPAGMGPMTGGARGFCTGNPAARWPGYGRWGAWCGWGGRGMPWIASSYGTIPVYHMSREQELDYLRYQAEAAEEELKHIEARIEQLEKQKSGA